MRKRVEVTYEVVPELCVQAVRRDGEVPRVAIRMIEPYRALTVPEALELISAIRVAIEEAAGHGT